MPTISAEFSHWDGDRAYINYYVDGFHLGVHYRTEAIKGLPTECTSIGNWGWTYDIRYKSKQGYVRGYKINDGNITLTLAVRVDVGYDVCYEGDYHPEWVEASTSIYIPKKIVPCNQSFKIINNLNNQPVPNAVITIFESPYPECTTDSNGTCSIPNLIKGNTYQVAVNIPEYYTGGGTYTVCNGTITISITPFISPECAEGAEKCEGYQLYKCIDLKWQLIEANSPTCGYVPLPECINGVHEILEYCPDGITPKRWRDCISGVWVEGTYTCPSCIESTHEILEYCPDTTTPKIWRDCISGVWVEYSQPCPTCIEGTSEVIDFCHDSITPKRWQVCTDGIWVEHTQPCPVCTEGEYEVLESCPDGTPKRWRKCISGTWVEDSYPCPSCTEGEAKCFNLDLYECISGEWQLKELNSNECELPPEEPTVPPSLSLFETIINSIAELLGLTPEQAKSVLTISIIALCVIILMGLI